VPPSPYLPPRYDHRQPPSVETNLSPDILNVSLSTL